MVCMSIRVELLITDNVTESAFDPEHPYYDEKSSREAPKWEVVHVEFRQKFPEIIRLKELQMFAKAGGILENMQTLRRSRLSVSKVTEREWDFIISLIETEDANIATNSDEVQPAAQTSVSDGNDRHAERTDSAKE